MDKTLIRLLTPAAAGKGCDPFADPGGSLRGHHCDPLHHLGSLKWSLAMSVLCCPWSRNDLLGAGLGLRAPGGGQGAGLQCSLPGCKSPNCSVLMSLIPYKYQG